MADDKLIIPVGFNFNIEEIDKEWQAKKAEIEKGSQGRNKPDFQDAEHQESRQLGKCRKPPERPSK